MYILAIGFLCFGSPRPRLYALAFGCNLHTVCASCPETNIHECPSYTSEITIIIGNLFWSLLPVSVKTSSSDRK